MNGHEIIAELRKHEDIFKYFNGIYSINNLPNKLVDGHCIIVNTSKSHERVGHWVALSKLVAHNILNTYVQNT